MKDIKKLIIIQVIILLVILSLSGRKVYAEEHTIILISDSGITVNGEKIGIDTSAEVYLSNNMDNGGKAEEAINSNIAIENIININDAGTYEISGTLASGQISVNANKINGEVRIILNNVDITCEDAPAIFIYSKDVKNENCKVTIELASGSTNNIVGGKLKQSVEGWEDQDEILYYVDKGYDDDRQYYERYKYDGAISSDVSLIFEGEGMLNVTSNAKEGIESKMNITINGGTYYIKSLDDGINACTDNESVITINGGKIIVNVLDEADEGDGIDSNGYIYINGGTIYSFAHPGSDNGLDSDLGTYINGGTILATGSMYEEAKTTNNTQIIQMNFSSQVSSGESIVIVDEENNPIVAYKTDRNVSTFVYSSSNLSDEEYSIYTGTSMEGVLDDNNIYSEIYSIDLSQMTKQENNINSINGVPNKMTQRTNGLDLETTIKKSLTVSGAISGIFILCVLGILLIIKVSK